MDVSAQSLFANGNGSSSWPFVRMYSSSVAGGAQDFTTISISLDTEYLLTATTDGSNITVTLTALADPDDVQSVTIANASVATQNQPMGLGAKSDGTSLFDGLIWDVTIEQNDVITHNWAVDDNAGTLVDTASPVQSMTLNGTQNWGENTAVNGSGRTEADAWANFTPAQTLYDNSPLAAGSAGARVGLDNTALLVKRDTTLYTAGTAANDAMLAVAAPHGLVIGAYGTGARPIISNKRATDPVPGDFTEVTPGAHWTIASVNGTTIPMSLVINGEWFTEQDLQADAANEPQDNTYWLDTTTGTQHVYSSSIDISALTGSDTIETTAGGQIFNLGSRTNGDRYTENLLMRDLDLQHGDFCVELGNGYRNVRFINVRARWTLDAADGSTTAMPIYLATSRADGEFSTGLLMDGCDLRDSNDQILFLAGQDGSVYRDCFFGRTANTHSEWKGHNKNLLFDRCRWHRCAGRESSQSLRMTSDGNLTFVGAIYNNIVFVNNEFYNPRRQYQVAANPSSVGAEVITVFDDAQADVLFVNSTGYTENRELVDGSQTTNTLHIRSVNCAWLMNRTSAGGLTGSAHGFYRASATADEFVGTDSPFGANVNTNHNVYYELVNRAATMRVGGASTSFTAWQALTGSPDADSVKGNDSTNNPNLIAFAADGLSEPNLRPQAGSSLIGVGDQLDEAGAVNPWVPAVDLDGNPRDLSNITAGAYQYAA